MARYGEESYFGGGPRTANFYQDFGQREALDQMNRSAAMRQQLLAQGGQQATENTRRRWEALANIPREIGEGYYEGKEEARKTAREKRTEEEHQAIMEEQKKRGQLTDKQLEEIGLGLEEKRAQHQYYYGAPGGSEEAHAAATPAPAPWDVAGVSEAPPQVPLAANTPPATVQAPMAPPGGGVPRWQAEHEAAIQRQRDLDTRAGKESEENIAASKSGRAFTGFQMAQAKTEAEKARITALRTGAAQKFATAEELRKQGDLKGAQQLELSAENTLRENKFSDQDILQVKTQDAAQAALQSKGSAALVYSSMPGHQQAVATLADANALAQKLAPVAQAIQAYDETPAFYPNDLTRARGGVYQAMAGAGMEGDFALAEKGAIEKTSKYRDALSQKVNAQLSSLQQARGQAAQSGDQDLVRQIDAAIQQLAPLTTGGGMALGGIIRKNASYRGGAQHNQMPAAGTSNAQMLAPGAPPPTNTQKREARHVPNQG